MEMTDAARHGAELVQHRPGYNSVICSRAERDVALRDWTYIPFGMEHNEAMGCTRLEVGSLFNGDPIPFKRIVICLGSGMSAAGVLHGLRYSSRGHKVPVLGVRIGADPTKRLDGFAPMGWRNQMKVVTSRHDYTDHVDARVDGVLLDPHYEAKCAEYLQPGDLFWIVGIRAGLA
jgi:1-aminocyclopropane-1-carboxylate deaminase/D-cysteine desulfhydrase-like pyridoxal-dependent ACC family enzyme